MSARDQLITYAATTRTITADGLTPYLNAFAAEVRAEAAADVHRAELPQFPAGETPENVAKVVRAVDVRLAERGPEAPYGVTKEDEAR